MRLFHFLFLIISACPWQGISSPLPDSSTPVTTQASTPDSRELVNLVATLENEQKRSALIQDLKLLLQVQQKNNETQAEHPAVNLVLGEFLESTLNVFLNLKKQFWAFIKVFKSPPVQHILAEFSWVILLAIGGGYLVEKLFYSLFNKLYRSLEQRARNNHLGRMHILLVQGMTHVLALMVFTLVAVIIAYMCHPQQRTERLIFFTVAVVTCFKAYQRSLEITLNPQHPELRLAPLTTITAHSLYKFSCMLGLSFAFAYELTSALKILQASRESIFLVVKVSTVLISSYTIYATRRLKPMLNEWIVPVKEMKDGHFSQMNRLVIKAAKSWHPVLSVYATTISLVILTCDIGRYEIRTGLLAETTVVIIIAYLLMLIIPRIIHSLFTGLEEKYALIKPRLHAYRRIFAALSSIAVLATATIYCAQIWKIRFITSFLESGNNKALLQGLSLALILVVGIAAWELNEIFVERKFGAQPKTGKNKLLTAEAQKRLKTIQPLVRNTGRCFILLFIILMLFSELGLNIAPLLAGASVFGIALSLGGQTLVKDIITGSFILIEDTMNIGDYVTIGNHTGRIENMSLRTVTLRDSYGGVHSIPFSSINTIINSSKSYSICIFNFVIAHTIDKTRVIQVLMDVVQMMRQEPLWAEEILEPLEVLGVPAFDSGSYTLRVQIKVAPGRQWRVERELNWRFSQALDHHKITPPISKQWMIIEKAPVES